MDYLQTTVTVTPYHSDAAQVLMTLMADVGYESFEETAIGFEAYIPVKSLNEDELASITLPFEGISFNYIHTQLETKNWNEEWEKNYFQPIAVGNQVVIRSPFHKEYPAMPIEVIIAPKMAFGTGHHETTSMMIEHILDMEMEGKRVLDMGCGTGILGILASMKGAKEVVGIDIDDWCVENSRENREINNIKNMELIQGTAESLKALESFDIILANINRNILISDLPSYIQKLKNKGSIILSGFYRQDLETINQSTETLFLTKIKEKENNKWVAVAYEKRNNQEIGF